MIAADTHVALARCQALFEVLYKGGCFSCSQSMKREPRHREVKEQDKGLVSIQGGTMQGRMALAEALHHCAINMCMCVCISVCVPVGACVSVPVCVTQLTV